MDENVLSATHSTGDLSSPSARLTEQTNLALSTSNPGLPAQPDKSEVRLDNDGFVVPYKATSQLLAKRARSLVNLHELNKRPCLSLSVACRPPTPFPHPQATVSQPPPSACTSNASARGSSSLSSNYESASSSHHSVAVAMSPTPYSALAFAALMRQHLAGAANEIEAMLAEVSLAPLARALQQFQEALGFLDILESVLATSHVQDTDQAEQRVGEALTCGVVPCVEEFVPL